MLKFIFIALNLNIKVLIFFKSYRINPYFGVFIILHILLLMPAKSQLILIQNEFEKFGFQSLNSRKFITIDTLNQLQLNGISRLALQDLTINGIEIFSKFDGGYALQFLPVFLTCDTSEIKMCKQNYASNTKNEYLTKAALFSGNKNGFFQAHHRGRYRSFSWLIHPYLEINNGIYYSDKQISFFEQKIVENSSYQNISGRIEFGISNTNSYLLFDSHLSFANLYKPINLLDSTKIKHKFSDYNNLLAQIKFSNPFTDFIKISGNIFLKNFYRNQSTEIDSNIFNFDIYKSDFEIEEFNYGINAKIDYDSRLIDNPTELKLSYSQDLFLVKSSYIKFRSRIEAENLQMGLMQRFDYSDKGKLTIELMSKSRALLYSSLGKLPKNVSFIDLSINNQYNFDSTTVLTNSFARKGIMPFVIYYYKIFEFYQSNLNIEPEMWYILNNEIKININRRLNIVPFINFYYCQNVILLDEVTKQYSANGNSKGLQIGITGEYQFPFISFKFNGWYNYQLVNDNNVLISNSLRTPRYNFDLNFNHNIFDFLEAEINFNFHDGVFSFNSTMNRIERLPPTYTINVMLQKQYDNSFFTVIFRNLTNKYSETNFGLPDRGISFLFGTGINF